MDSILIIILAVILSAFFSGMEIAFIASNRLIIELDRKQGGFGSGILKLFTANPGQYIATMLIGNNVALVMYGLVFSNILTPKLSLYFSSEVVILIINTLISTLLILLVAEFLPKTVFIISPNFFLRNLSVPTLFFFLIFYPVSKLTLAISDIFIRVFFGLKSNEKKQEDLVFTKVDLDHFINQSRQVEEKTGAEHHNIRIFQNALDFSNVRLRECMVPRTEIDAVDTETNIDELKHKFIVTGHSRILVYEDTIDNITGYAELKDLFKNPSNIKSVIRKLAIVPETMPANRLLKLFVDEKKNIALVVDEFGGTSGMVTIEDVLEEIFSEIQDEHDINDLTEKKISDSEYVLSGRIEIDYLNDKYNLNLPDEGDFETLAGLILYFHGSIPGNNDIIRIGNIVIRVLRATATRLELVNLKIE